MAMGGKFVAYAPHHKGMATTEQATRDVLSVIHNATLEANGGNLVSHFGNKQWLWFQGILETQGMNPKK